MKYRLVYTRRAERDIKKLDPVVKRQIAGAVVKLENDPIGSSERLVEPTIGTYRFRVGEYRVIFDLEGQDIVVLRVGHRREIYRRHG